MLSWIKASPASVVSLWIRTHSFWTHKLVVLNKLSHQTLIKRLNELLKIVLDTVSFTNVFSEFSELEKWQKKSLCQDTEGSEWYQIDPKWLRRSLMLIYDQFVIIQNFQTSPIPQTSFLTGTFLILFWNNFSPKGNNTQ